VSGESCCSIKEIRMGKFLVLASLVALAACETRTQTVTAAGTTGALIGAAVADDDDRLAGAAIGGAAGIVAGTLIGPSTVSGNCVYRNAAGERLIAPCP
jgi:hypothetical protein